MIVAILPIRPTVRPGNMGHARPPGLIRTARAIPGIAGLLLLALLTVSCDRPAPARAACRPVSTGSAVGGGHGVTIRQNGSLWTWGENASGQLGDETTARNDRPTWIRSVGRVVAIAASGKSSLAVDADGRVWAWGALFDGRFRVSGEPATVAAVPPAVAVAGGNRYALALTREGTVFEWGFELDAPALPGEEPLAPRMRPGLTDIVAIAVSPTGDHALALGRNGHVTAWGNGRWGQLGDGTGGALFNPNPYQGNVEVSGLTDVTAISAGAYHSLALRRDGSVWSWGSNFHGQLGDGGTSDHNIPFHVPLPGPALAVHAGPSYSFAIARAQGRLMAWGEGPFGNGAASTRSLSPMMTTELENLTAVWSGYVFGGRTGPSFRGGGAIEFPPVPTEVGNARPTIVVLVQQGGQVLGWGARGDPRGGEIAAPWTGDGTANDRLSPTPMAVDANPPHWSDEEINAGLTATRTGPDRARIMWPAATDSSGRIRSYQIYQDAVWLLGVPGTTTSYEATGLQEDRDYVFSVGAVDEAGLGTCNDLLAQLRLRPDGGLDVSAPTPSG